MVEAQDMGSKQPGKKLRGRCVEDENR
jgi:hypothetical protein